MSLDWERNPEHWEETAETWGHHVKPHTQGGCGAQTPSSGGVRQMW